jgi:molybdate transport system regulatory protein
VGQTGSISQAAREAGISYKAAWQAIETLTHLSGLPLVDRSVGGSGGGGARITPQGLQLLALADELAQARAQVLARHAQGGAGGALPPLHLGLRTSMRNQVPCVVTAVTAVAHGPMVAVDLRTPCGQALASLVTRESADLLGLAPGLAVLALCKATAVAVVPVGTDTAEPSDTACTLQGVVADVSPGLGAQEVALTLPSGHLWVGFAPQTEGLVVGRAASGRFAPSAVVMGLAS